ncbi:MAG: hypothetical protein B6229_00685 [Spirochaetaceae bacterium 4572_7]|nr:MAG: hypothetical protein B6229_00685 [Spirochaetaceae bacterium 4572_7]
MRKNSAEYSALMDDSVKGSFKSFFSKRITLMLIPHSEKKVFNIQVSLFSIIAVIALFVGLLFSFFILSSGYTGSLKVIDDRDGRILKAEADIYKTSKSVDKLSESAEKFKLALNRTLQATNITNETIGDGIGEGGDLNNLLNIQNSDASSSNDVKRIENVTDLLTESAPKLVQMGDLISKKNEH